MVKNRFEEYKMPTGRYEETIAKQFEELRRDERYRKAKSCIHCTDMADSFNRYVSTYCHVLNKSIAGFGDVDLLDVCDGCEHYIAWDKRHEKG